MLVDWDTRLPLCSLSIYVSPNLLDLNTSVIDACSVSCWCRIQVLYINIILYIYSYIYISTPKCRVVNVCWTESQCISKAAQKDCAMSVWVKRTSPPWPSPHCFPFHLLIYFKTNLFHTSWTKTAKKCMQDILNIFRIILGWTATYHTAPRCSCFLVLGHTLQTLLWLVLSDCCSFCTLSICKIVFKCLYLIFKLSFLYINFIIKNSASSPWCLEDHIV